MTEKRFIRTISGEIYDSENDSFIHQDYVGKPIEYEDECIKLLNELHEENKKLKQVNEMLQMDFAMTERNLIEKNEQLKSFIKSLASPDGKIWLSSGYGYRIDKILNDFNNTENDDGDV